MKNEKKQVPQKRRAPKLSEKLQGVDFKKISYLFENDENITPLTAGLQTLWIKNAADTEEKPITRKAYEQLPAEEQKEYIRVFPEEITIFCGKLKNDLQIVQGAATIVSRENLNTLPADHPYSHSFNDLKNASDNNAMPNTIKTNLETFTKDHPGSFQSTFSWFKPWTWFSNEVKAPKKQEQQSSSWWNPFSWSWFKKS